MRTTISEKAGRIRVERELLAGTQWHLVTRLTFASVTEAVSKFPKGWNKGAEISTIKEETHGDTGNLSSASPAETGTIESAGELSLGDQ